MSYVYARTDRGWKQALGFRLGAQGESTTVAVSGKTIVAVVNGVNQWANGTYILKKTPAGWRKVVRLDPMLYRDGGAPAVSGNIAVVGGNASVYLLHV